VKGAKSCSEAVFKLLTICENEKCQKTIIRMLLSGRVGLL